MDERKVGIIALIDSIEESLMSNLVTAPVVLAQVVELDQLVECLGMHHHRLDVNLR
jgi:hypothetical protein